MGTEVLCRINQKLWSTSILQELSELRQSSTMCDVKILLSGGVQTAAHRCVLSAASPFFKSLLVQIENPEIDMSTFPSDVILCVLDFIYTGEALFSAVDLLIAHKVATMFRITSLAALIQNMLLEGQSEDSHWDNNTIGITATTMQQIQDVEPVADKQMLTVDEYQEDDGIGGPLVQETEPNLIPDELENLENIPSLLLKSDHEGLTTESDVLNESSGDYTIESYQLQSVLDDLGNVVEMVTPKPKPKRKLKKNAKTPLKIPRIKEKPVRIINKELARDVDTTDGDTTDGDTTDRAIQTIPDEVILQISTDNEFHVVCTVPLPRGSTLGPYEGQIITDPDLIVAVDPRYCWTIYSNCKLLHWLSGEDLSQANWMRFIRAADDSEANLRAFQTGGQLYFEVLRRIAPSEELLVSNAYIGFRGKVCNEDLGSSTKVKSEKREDEDKKSADESTSVKPEVEMEGFHCEDCDIIFIMEDMYSRHLHKVHGQPLPIQLYIGDMGEQRDASHDLTNQKSEGDGKSGSSEIVVTHVNKQQIKKAAKPCTDVDSRKDLAPDMDETQDQDEDQAKNQAIENETDEGGVLATRKSTRTRRRSKRLTEFDTASESEQGVVKEKAIVKEEKTDKSIINKSISDKSISDKSISDKSIFEADKTLSDSDMEVVDAASDKPYVCKRCQKRFKLEASLKRHLVIHTADEPDQIKCDECGRRFTHLGNLTIHKRTHTGEKPYKCQFCGRGFSQKGNLALHVRRHTGENNHTCEQCGKSYNDSSYLLKHIRAIHDPSRKISCSICNKSLFDEASLKRHMCTHTKTKLYKCGVCGKGFTHYSNLQSHKRIHTAEKPFPCQKCSMCFRNKHDLNVHLIGHSGEKPFSCKICFKLFGYSGSQKKHEQMGCRPTAALKTDSSMEIDELFKCRHCEAEFVDHVMLNDHMAGHFWCCSYCKRLFTSELLLDEHRERHEGATDYTCTICEKVFHIQRDFKEHQRTHAEKKHVCDVCQKTCISASTLQKHILIHTGEKPHPCPICNIHFRIKHQLKRHLETHDPNGTKQLPKGPRPICSQCGKSFYDQQALKKHEFVHTGVKPFSCRFCGKTFAARGGCKTHESSHLGVKPYTCGVCGKAYRSNVSYQQHVVGHQDSLQCPHCNQTFTHVKNLRQHLKSHPDQVQTLID